MLVAAVSARRPGSPAPQSLTEPKGKDTVPFPECLPSATLFQQLTQHSYCSSVCHTFLICVLPDDSCPTREFASMAWHTEQFYSREVNIAFQNANKYKREKPQMVYGAIGQVDIVSSYQALQI